MQILLQYGGISTSADGERCKNEVKLSSNCWCSEAIFQYFWLLWRTEIIIRAHVRFWSKILIGLQSVHHLPLIEGYKPCCLLSVVENDVFGLRRWSTWRSVCAEQKQFDNIFCTSLHDSSRSWLKISYIGHANRLSKMIDIMLFIGLFLKISFWNWNQP